ncbi:hypothetical protein HanIR_Chr16g0827731 [Helianthus annuus]|nr:hypothetical protein HanIR_Chr16g0827731 [Helianthus annuus]
MFVEVIHLLFFDMPLYPFMRYWKFYNIIKPKKTFSLLINIFTGELVT